MIRVNKALCEDFCKHVTNIYGVASSDKLHVGIDYLAMDYAMDYVSSKIDSYLVDDETINYLASQIAKVLILTLKRKIEHNERKYGICLF